MTDVEIFKLSRVYAQGWNAANTISASDYSKLSPAKLTALKPYAAEPQWSRWNYGFQAAIQKQDQMFRRTPGANANLENGKGFAITTTHTIRYRRPREYWSVVSMTVPDGTEATLIQKMRLEALGYFVIDVTPGLQPVGTLPTHSEPR